MSFFDLKNDGNKSITVNLSAKLLRSLIAIKHFQEHLVVFP